MRLSFRRASREAHVNIYTGWAHLAKPKGIAKVTRLVRSGAWSVN